MSLFYFKEIFLLFSYVNTLNMYIEAVQ